MSINGPISTRPGRKLPGRTGVPRLRQLFMAVAGGAVASFGLDMFLVPNGLITGGVTGMSALASQVTGLKTGLFLFLLNLPLFLLLYRKSNRTLVLTAVAGLLGFSLSSLLLHPLPALLDAGAAAAAFGGGFLGVGIGIAMRSGAVLDLLQLSRLPDAVKTVLSRRHISRTSAAVNMLLLTLAGILLGLEQAIYSAIAALFALEAVKFAISGFSLHREVVIKTDHPRDMRQAIESLLSRQAEEPEVDPVHMERPSERPVLIYRVHLLEIARLKALIRSADPEAAYTISPRHGPLSRNKEQAS